MIRTEVSTTADMFLTFDGHYDRDKGLDNGRLCLRSITQGTLQVWMATSATASKQTEESMHERGGIIPPEYRLLNVRKYEVVVSPLDRRDTVGIEGNFYPIQPFIVTTDKGAERSDLGIHRDANVPGSMGCIVMSAGRFKSFEEEMLKLSKSYLGTVPLFVTYS